MKPIIEEPSPMAAAEPVACEVVRGRDFGCVWHHHPACEITLVKRGGTERLVGEKLTPLKPGDLVMLGSDLPHDYRNDPRACSGPVEALVVQFTPQLFGEGWLQHPSMRPVQELFQRARLGLEITGRTRLRAARHATHIVEATGLRRLRLLLELLEMLATSNELVQIASPGFEVTPRHGAADRIGMTCGHIEKNLSDEIYLSNLAAMSGLSESGFSRLFRKSTGRTLPRYINELRISRACRLLAETDDTVAQIATACGYVTPAHFQRQFHAHQQRSPLAYRHAVRRAAN